MKSVRWVVLGAAAISMSVAHASPTYTTTFQGVAFSLAQIDADTLVLQIDNAINATGDWSGIRFLGAFDIKSIGENSGSATAVANGAGAANLAGLDSQLSASNIDCSSGGSPPEAICFNLSPHVPLTGDMTYTIAFSSPLDIASNGPHLQIAFTTTQGGSKVGSLSPGHLSPTTRTRGTSDISSGSNQADGTNDPPTNASSNPTASSVSATGDNVGTRAAITTSSDPVPEPNTLALLGLGVAILARRVAQRSAS